MANKLKMSSSHLTTIRIPSTLHERVDTVRRYCGLSQNTLLVALIEAGLDATAIEQNAECNGDAAISPGVTLLRALSPQSVKTS